VTTVPASIYESPLLDHNEDLARLLPYTINDDQTVTYSSTTSDNVLTFEAVVTALLEVVVPEACTMYYQRTTVEFTQSNGSIYRLSSLPQVDDGVRRFTTLKGSYFEAADPQVLLPGPGISSNLTFDKLDDIYTSITLGSRTIEDAVALVISDQSTTIAVLYMQKDVGLAAIEQDGELFWLTIGSAYSKLSVCCWLRHFFLHGYCCGLSSNG